MLIMHGSASSNPRLTFEFIASAAQTNDQRRRN